MASNFQDLSCNEALSRLEASVPLQQRGFHSAITFLLAMMMPESCELLSGDMPARPNDSPPLFHRASSHPHIFYRTDLEKHSCRAHCAVTQRAYMLSLCCMFQPTTTWLMTSGRVKSNNADGQLFVCPD